MQLIGFFLNDWLLSPLVIGWFADGTWGGWVLQSSSGESGVWWTGKLKPAYQIFEGALNVYDGAYGVYNRWAPSWAPFRQPAGAPKAEGSKA